MEEFNSMKEILDKYGKYTGLTKGISMQPMIHQGKDNIIVVKTNERLKKYDVPVYINSNGQYVMHRVVEVHDDHYIIMGDNCNYKEHVTDDKICGKLVGYYHFGKKYIDLEKNIVYKLYSRIWVALIPIRPFTMFLNRCLNFVDKRTFKRYISGTE